MRRKAFKNHLLQHKSTSRKSRLSQKAVVVDADVPNIEGMMPYL